MRAPDRIYVAPVNSMVRPTTVDDETGLVVSSLPVKASRVGASMTELDDGRILICGGAKVRGLYIWGAVGRGKSMLMDLFFEATALKEKRRVHFHDFMLEAHAFIFEWRKLSHAEKRKHPAHVRDAGDDPIAPTAKHIADRARLLGVDLGLRLCLDRRLTLDRAPLPGPAEAEEKTASG